MKKILLTQFIFIFILGNSSAQFFPMEPILNCEYSQWQENRNQMLLIDSHIYVIRSGGLEELNINSKGTKYYWANYYEVKAIVKDTGSTYAYLKNNNFIGRYNYSTLHYENIWPDSLKQKQITDIAISPDGKVWATIGEYYAEIAVYDGIIWRLFPYPAYLYTGFSNIKVVNNSMVYVRGGYTKFFAFHNGIYDTVFTIPYTGDYFRDWDIDPDGNLWIAAQNKLYHIFNGTTTIYDASNTPLGNEQFLHVKAGTNGIVWTAGNFNELLKFNGETWQKILLPDSYLTIEHFVLNEQNLPVVIAHGYNSPKIYMDNNNSWSSLPFPFMPLQKIKAIGVNDYYYSYGSDGYFASDEGIFRVYLNDFHINDFCDSTMNSYSGEVTCFAQNSHDFMVFGTSHGVGNLSGFSNAQMPNQQVNCIYYENGTYYIGTDSGMVTYNGILYNVINTSNSPVPSDKITFISAGNNYFYSNYNALFVGTDRGLAIYQNAEWKVYDSSNIPLNSFYVTGAVPSWPDSTIYISTLGSGLIKVFPDGNYELFNTSNGNFLDDYLFYIKQVMLAECGDYMIIGTQNHGMAFTEMFGPENFNYLTSYNGFISINSSTMAAGSYFSEMNLISTDSLMYILTPCGSVKEINSKIQFKWNIQEDNLVVTLAESNSGDGKMMLIDILGRTQIEKDINSGEGRVKVNIGNLISGIYIIKIKIGNKEGFNKAVISN